MMPEPPRRPDLRADGSPIGTPAVQGSATATLPDGRPKVTWTFLPTLGIALLGFLLGSLAAAPIFAAFGDTTAEGASGVSELAQGLVVDVVLIGTLFVWLRSRHPGWSTALRLVPSARVGREVAIGAGLGVVVRIVAGIAAAAMIAVLTAVTDRDVSVPEQVTGDLHGFELVIFALFAVVVAPITEEFLFRGLIYRSVRDRHGVALGAIVSAVLFGVIHYVPGPWPDAVALQVTMVVTGVGLALVYERRKTLLAPIVGHAAFNLIAVVVIVYDALR
ncbi:MAG TPA: type II CAAX endopeptidase family protein [Actinomycetota bacterium]|nr:type II CAAX endopeptidase family protein [Actinomycetota bacterium]